MTKDLMMYTRTTGCPFVMIAKRVLDEHQIQYTEIFIDQDADAQARVIAWTGFLSVPTLIIADDGTLEPCQRPPDKSGGL